MRALLPRASVRLQLTLLYGGLFLLAGAALLAVNYALVRSRFTLPFHVEVAPPGSQPPPDYGPGQGVRLLITQVGGGDVIAGAGSPQAVETVRQQLQAAALSQLLTQSGIALGLMALASVGLGWLVAGRVLRPLQAITATARRLEGSTLHERINLQGPEDELKELADTFDQMLARLDTAFETQRRFVANASHELRTPLAIARTEVDVALADPDASPAELRAMAERVREASERSERLIEGLLTLARSERRLRAREPVDLSASAAEALSAAAGEAERLGLRVSAVLGHRGGEVDGHLQAALGEGAGLGASAVGRGHRAHDRQAEAGAAVGAGAVAFQPPERLEQRRHLLGRDRPPAVGDPDHGHAVG